MAVVHAHLFMQYSGNTAFNFSCYNGVEGVFLV